jgi:hypothetical protein
MQPKSGRKYLLGPKGWETELTIEKYLTFGSHDGALSIERWPDRWVMNVKADKGGELELGFQDNASMGSIRLRFRSKDRAIGSEYGEISMTLGELLKRAGFELTYGNELTAASTSQEATA